MITLTEEDCLSLWQAMEDAVYLLDPDTSMVVWCNRSGYEVLGLSADAVLDHSVLSLQKDVTGLPQWQDIAQAIRSVPCFTFIGRHRHANGGEVSVEVNTTQVTLSNQAYFLSIARNITLRVDSRQDNGTNHQLAFVMNEALDGLWDWCLSDNSVIFSPSLKQMLGYGPDEMEPTLETWKYNIHPDDLTSVLTQMVEHLRGNAQRFESEYRLRNRNGDYLWVHDRGKVCERDASGVPQRVVGMVQNITQRKSLELSLEHFAHVDSLTLLPNRWSGEEQMLFWFEQAKSSPDYAFSLAVIDIDRFKYINDLLGHQRGDEVLRVVAKIMISSLTEEDYVFRWGGEEFFLMIPSNDTDFSFRLCERLRQRVESAEWTERYFLPPVTVSIGLSVMDESVANLTTLIDRADQAMYLAKQQGRNRTTIWVDSPSALPNIIES